jgi:hypothetical protein
LVWLFYHYLYNPLGLSFFFLFFTVGGSETKINEYPSMAGVVDASERRIYCGATISI